MKDYIHVRIDCKPCSEVITDLLAAELGESGFESFVPDENGLSAYIPAEAYNKEETEGLVNSSLRNVDEYRISEELIPGKDWNEEWEKNYFQPIVIGKECGVRSSFHEPIGTDIEIIIDPKMAFGTGHHSTTSQMMGYLLDMELQDKKVLDMGAGTGILSILATKRGAKAVGIEIDPDAADNARENCMLNGCDSQILTGDANLLDEFKDADLLIANINRNIILADMSRYCASLKQGGEMLLSGFYTTDIPLIKASADLHGLEIAEIRSSEDNWAALRLIKTKG